MEHHDSAKQQEAQQEQSAMTRSPRPSLARSWPGSILGPMERMISPYGIGTVSPFSYADRLLHDLEDEMRAVLAPQYAEDEEERQGALDFPALAPGRLWAAVDVK